MRGGHRQVCPCTVTYSGAIVFGIIVSASVALVNFVCLSTKMSQCVAECVAVCAIVYFAMCCM